jgi:hypothetical protein
VFIGCWEVCLSSRQFDEMGFCSDNPDAATPWTIALYRKTGRSKLLSLNVTSCEICNLSNEGLDKLFLDSLANMRRANSVNGAFIIFAVRD